MPIVIHDKVAICVIVNVHRVSSIKEQEIMVYLQFRQKLETIVSKLPVQSIPDELARLKKLFQLGLQSEADLRAIVFDEQIDEPSRTFACWPISRLNNASNIDTLITLLENPISAIRVVAAQGLANFPNDLVTSALMKSLYDPIREVRIASAQSLGWMNNDRATQALIARLQEEDEGPREKGVIAEALGNTSSEKAIEQLTKMLQSEHSEIRFWSAYALGELCAQSAIPDLEKIVSDTTKVDEYGSVGDEAKQALSKIRMCVKSATR